MNTILTQGEGSKLVMSELRYATQPLEAKSTRLFFIDNLRVALIILVVLHHVAMIYEGDFRFNYVDPADNPLTSSLLLIFLMCNQAFFMGLFFFISGYFTPGSFDRKGAWPFMKERLITLGIPFLLYMFLLSPIAWLPSALASFTLPFTWPQYFSLVEPGPLWFALMLLIFNLGYLLWRTTRRANAEEPARSNVSPLHIQTICFFILAQAVVSYLFRIIAPTNNVFLLFPCFGYFPQYLSFFILGVLANRRDWLRTFPGNLGILGFIVAIVCTFCLFPAALGDADRFVGGGSWQSGAFALWDSTFAVGISLALLTLFRRFLNQQGELGRFLQKHTFSVYVLHR